LGGSIHTVKKNAKALLIGSKEIGLVVNAGGGGLSTLSYLEIRMQDKVAI